VYAASVVMVVQAEAHATRNTSAATDDNICAGAGGRSWPRRLWKNSDIGVEAWYSLRGSVVCYTRMRARE
jgi:hypothetical protein